MVRPGLNYAERDLLALVSVDLATGMGGIWIYAGTPVGLIRVPDCFCRWQDVQPGNAMDALVSGDAPPSQAPLPAGEPIHALASAPSAPETVHAALPSGVWTSRSEEHTSELQSLMRISYAVFCLKKKIHTRIK